jgi:diphthamide biosynthesis protein 2
VAILSIAPKTMTTEAATSVLPLYSNAEEVLSRKVEIAEDDDGASVWLSPEKQLIFFEVNETADWIKENKFDRVALQFPDELLRYSLSVSRELEKRTHVKPFILADTSYGRSEFRS